MKIVLVNAAAPVKIPRGKYTPEAFAVMQEEWMNLPAAPISGAQKVTAEYRIWTAESLCARQTAEQWLKNENGEPVCYEATALLNEIPLLPYTDREKSIPLWKYQWMGKRQWKRGDSRQPESRAQSLEKAERLLDILESGGEDALLISHERRILFLLDVLREKKYQIRRGSVFRLEPLERILAAKEIRTCGRCAHNCQLDHPGCDIGRDKARLLRLRNR